TGDLADPFQGLEFKDPVVLSEIFEGLNQEATKTPEVIAGIDQEIATLTSQVEALKAEVADAVDFSAAGEQLLSGYQDVLTALEAETGETFSDLAVTASQAFTSRFAEESARLKRELEAEIGPIVDAAGLTAGEGLMTAFASGVTAN